MATVSRNKEPIGELPGDLLQTLLNTFGQTPIVDVVPQSLQLYWSYSDFWNNINGIGYEGLTTHLLFSAIDLQKAQGSGPDVAESVAMLMHLFDICASLKATGKAHALGENIAAIARKLVKRAKKRTLEKSYTRVGIRVTGDDLERRSLWQRCREFAGQYITRKAAVTGVIALAVAAAVTHEPIDTKGTTRLDNALQPLGIADALQTAKAVALSTPYLAPYAANQAMEKVKDDAMASAQYLGQAFVTDSHWNYKGGTKVDKVEEKRAEEAQQVLSNSLKWIGRDITTIKTEIEMLSNPMVKANPDLYWRTMNKLFSTEEGAVKLAALGSIWVMIETGGFSEWVSLAVDKTVNFFDRWVNYIIPALCYRYGTENILLLTQTAYAIAYQTLPHFRGFVNHLVLPKMEYAVTTFDPTGTLHANHLYYAGSLATTLAIFYFAKMTAKKEIALANAKRIELLDKEETRKHRAAVEYRQQVLIDGVRPQDSVNPKQLTFPTQRLSLPPPSTEAFASHLMCANCRAFRQYRCNTLF